MPDWIVVDAGGGYSIELCPDEWAGWHVDVMFVSPGRRMLEYWRTDPALWISNLRRARDDGDYDFSSWHCELEHDFGERCGELHTVGACDALGVLTLHGRTDPTSEMGQLAIPYGHRARVLNDLIAALTTAINSINDIKKNGESE